MARTLSFADCFEALQNDGRTSASEPRGATYPRRVVASDGAILELQTASCVHVLSTPERPATVREVPRWTLEEMRRILRLQ